jgi:hypothetical protein
MTPSPRKECSFLHSIRRKVGSAGILTGHVERMAENVMEEEHRRQGQSGRVILKCI